MLGWLCYGGCLLVPRGAALVASMEGAGLLPPTRASWPGTSRPSHSSFCPPAKVFRAFPHRSASDDLIHDVISHCESCHSSTTYRLPCSHRYCRRACSCADAPEVSVLNFFVSVEDVSVSFCDTGPFRGYAPALLQHPARAWHRRQKPPSRLPKIGNNTY
jgi:hypothetical protein